MNVPATVERRQGRAIQLANIARCHLRLGSTDRALALFHESLTICRDIGDRIGIADALDGIGSVHHATDDKDEAFAHYQEALRIAREISEHALTCQSLRNIGRTARGFRRLPLRRQLARGVARRLEYPRGSL